MLGMYFTKVKTTKVWRWRDVKDGDLKALRVIRWLGSKNLDNKAGNALTDDYLKTFGLSDEFKKQFELKKKIGLLQAEYLSDIMNNRKILNKIRRLEQELEVMQSNSEEHKPVSIGEQISYLWKTHGTRIDEKRDTIYTLENLIRSNGK